MPARNPAARYRATKLAEAVPEHPHERELWNALHNLPADENVLRGLEIYLGDMERETVQAWLIANATNAEITHYLRLTEAVLAPYRHLFFDVHVFRDELDVMRFVREYHGTEFGGNLLQNVMTSGIDYLVWAYSHGDCKLEPDTVKQNVMADGYFRGRLTRNYALGSKESQASHAFMATAFKAAVAIGERKAPDINQILIKLRYRDLTESVDEAVKHEEILH